MNARYERQLQQILWLILIWMCGCLLMSCSKTIYVPVESVRTEYRDVYTRDSIVVRDSVYMKVGGDTVWIEKYKTLYKERLVRDSVFLNDTIRVPYPVDKIVYQNKLKWYQEGLIYVGLLCLLFLAVRFRIKRF
ncbi:MAG: hypothetical protein LIP06_10745 [Tannerellaceae bacterium]|nr:hypothetical protein [Tannerellaceae bacterium]